MFSARSLANLKSVNCSVSVFTLDLSASDSALRLCKSSCVAVKLFSSSVMGDSFDCSTFIFLRSCCRIFSARSLVNLKSASCSVRLSTLDLYPSNSSLRLCNNCCFPATLFSNSVMLESFVWSSSVILLSSSRSRLSTSVFAVPISLARNFDAGTLGGFSSINRPPLSLCDPPRRAVLDTSTIMIIANKPIPPYQMLVPSITDGRLCPKVESAWLEKSDLRRRTASLSSHEWKRVNVPTTKRTVTSRIKILYRVRISLDPLRRSLSDYSLDFTTNLIDCQRQFVRMEFL